MPIQNLGSVPGTTRYEGSSAKRAKLLNEVLSFGLQAAQVGLKGKQLALLRERSQAEADDKKAQRDMDERKEKYAQMTKVKVFQEMRRKMEEDVVKAEPDMRDYMIDRNEELLNRYAKGIGLQMDKDGKGMPRSGFKYSKAERGGLMRAISKEALFSTLAREGKLTKEDIVGGSDQIGKMLGISSLGSQLDLISKGPQERAQYARELRDAVGRGEPVDVSGKFGAPQRKEGLGDLGKMTTEELEAAVAKRQSLLSGEAAPEGEPSGPIEGDKKARAALAEIYKVIKGAEDQALSDLINSDVERRKDAIKKHAESLRKAANKRRSVLYYDEPVR